MRVIDSELPVFIDVDKTLIMPVKIEDENDKKGLIPFDYAGTEVFMRPHHLHIDLLKHYKTRGYYVVVWSANGYQWAVQAVNKLGLEDHVDEVRSKPVKYVDDMECEAWMGQRVYIPFNEDI